MDAYVGVTNDVSLVVKKILQVKKAYRTQMKCHEDLTRKNKSTEQRICELEKRNKDLENKLTKLKCDKQNQEQIVSDLQEQLVLHLTNGVDVFGDVFVAEQSECPTTPTNSNKQGSKRKLTPKKKTLLPRKSRRVAIRKEKS